MKLLRKVGSTSQIFQIFIQDSSSSLGAGLTGLTNASSNLVAYYHRDTDTTATAISLVTMTVGTFTSSGFKEIDSTNMPGWYQFCPPNAALASGAASVGIHLKGATNMAPLPIEVDLDAQVDVTFWNGTVVATPATAGIPDVNAKNWNNLATVALPLIPTTAGRTLDVSAGGEAGVDWANVGSPTTTVGLSGTTVKTATDVETDTADIQARLPAALVGGRIDSNVGAISSDATAADNAEAFFDGTGYAGTGNTIPTVTNLTNAATNGDLTATMKASVNTEADTALSDYGALKPTVAARTLDVSAGGEAGIDWNNIGSPTTAVNLSSTNIDVDQVVASVSGAVGSVTTVSDKTGYRLSSTGVDDVLRTALTEGYATDGSTFTLEQALYMLWSLLAERNISSTTLTAKKLNGSTSAMTFTLDSATTPTSQTRAT